MGLGGCCYVVAPVRRWEDAEGDRDSGVKVQVDDLSGRELFSNAFRRARKEDKKGTLASGERRGKRARGTLLDSVFRGKDWDESEGFDEVVGGGWWDGGTRLIGMWEKKDGLEMWRNGRSLAFERKGLLCPVLTFLFTH